VGIIHYPNNVTGTLIYVKSSLTGKDEPADVLGYHKTAPAFPHESTADQWFNESQFESYRRLGLAIGEAVSKPIKSVLPAEQKKEVLQASVSGSNPA
jgi:hypothetical protein